MTPSEMRARTRITVAVTLFPSFFFAPDYSLLLFGDVTRRDVLYVFVCNYSILFLFITILQLIREKEIRHTHRRGRAHEQREIIAKQSEGDEQIECLKLSAFVQSHIGHHVTSLRVRLCACVCEVDIDSFMYRSRYGDALNTYAHTKLCVFETHRATHHVELKMRRKIGIC